MLQLWNAIKNSDYLELLFTVKQILMCKTWMVHRSALRLQSYTTCENFLLSALSNKTKPGLLEGSLNSKVLVFTRKKKKDFDLQKIRQRSLNKRSPQTWINATEKKVLETDKYDL